MQNYYDILGVDRKASFENLKAAYRIKALECHPDRGGSHKAMVEINEAWHVLSGPESRKHYDQMLAKGQVDVGEFAAAKYQAQTYERDWRKFNSWLNSVGRDFTDARFGSTEFAGFRIPTAKNSVSAWLFIGLGAIAGLCVWCLLFSLVAKSLANPEPPKPNKYLLGIELKRDKDPLKPYRPIMFFTIVGCGAGGAWLGKLAHVKFGKYLDPFLDVGDSTSQPSTPNKVSPAANRPPDKATEKQTNQCPTCSQKLRVPSSTKSLTITCPECKTRFEFPNQNNQQERTRMKFPPSKAALATLLRCMLIFEIVFTVITLGIGMFVSSMGEQILAEAGLVSPDVSMTAVAIFAVAIVILLPLGIASWVGLFQHKNWGRWLYLIGLLAGHLLLVFTGCFNWTYSWDLVAALDSISYLTSGVIVSICFLSPLASEFEQSSLTNPS